MTEQTEQYEMPSLNLVITFSLIHQRVLTLTLACDIVDGKH